MKTAVSIPDKTFRAADRLARQMGVSRSELYARAVAKFVAEQSRDGLTGRIDQALEGLDPAADEGFARLQRKSWARAARDEQW